MGQKSSVLLSNIKQVVFISIHFTVKYDRILKNSYVDFIGFFSFLLTVSLSLEVHLQFMIIVYFHFCECLFSSMLMYLGSV